MAPYSRLELDTHVANGKEKWRYLCIGVTVFASLLAIVVIVLGVRLATDQHGTRSSRGDDPRSETEREPSRKTGDVVPNHSPEKRPTPADTNPTRSPPHYLPQTRTPPPPEQPKTRLPYPYTPHTRSPPQYPPQTRPPPQTPAKTRPHTPAPSTIEPRTPSPPTTRPHPSALPPLPPSSAPAVDHVCITKDCIASAHQLQSKMNETRNPCDNFHAFACGNWEKDASFPFYNHEQVTQFSELSIDRERVIRDVLQEETTNSSSAAVIKAKELYDSCMDYDTVALRSVKHAKDLITRELGGFDFSKSFSVSGDWSIEDKVVEFGALQSLPIMKFSVGTAGTDTSKIVVFLEPPDFLVPPNFNSPTLELKEKQKMDYFRGTIKAFQPSATDSEINSVLTFLEKLLMAAIEPYTPPVEDDDPFGDPFAPHRRRPVPMYQKLSLSQLKAITGSSVLNWRKLFSKAFGKHVPSDYEVVVKDVGYFYHLSTGSHSIKDTPQSTIQNAFVFKLLLALQPYFVGDMREPLDSFIRKKKSLYMFPRPRWMSCVGVVKEAMPRTTRYIFYHTGFEDVDAVKQEISGMIDDVRSAMITNFQASWLSYYTKSRAIEKARAMAKSVAFPRDVKDIRLINEEAQKTPVEDGLVHTLVTIWRGNNRKVWDRYWKGVNDKMEWTDKPLTVNADYSPQKNRFTILAGILGDPFYDVSYPAYMKYAGIGLVIGHELTHGFDDEGRKYDKDGNLHNWWQSSDSVMFARKKKCFEDQYDDIPITGSSQHPDGTKTANENIADAGGLKVAYGGYLNWVHKNQAEKNLPVTKLNTWQRAFFTASAQLYCAKLSAEGISNEIKNDVHAFGEIRVNGMMMNSENFHEAFQCPLGSSMNPHIKCQMW